MQTRLHILKDMDTIRIQEEIFVIDTPPPYPSGTWHIGAVAQYSMIDVIAQLAKVAW